MNRSECGARPLSVLVVDGDPRGAASAVLRLARSGFRAASAASGTEAVAATLADPPDVVMVELAMPGVDGFQLARRLNGLGAGPRPRLVAVTAQERADDRRRAAESGFDGFVVKPAASGVVAGLLTRLADDRPRRGGSAPPAGRGAPRGWSSSRWV